jgi:4'-phosphopantetheinyl transferase
MIATTGRRQASCMIASARIKACSEQSMHRLSASVINQAAQLSSERRQQYLTGRMVLAELLFQSSGISQLPDIFVTNNGRPSFNRADLPDFNISHSGDLIMVALAQDCQIGVDLELKRPRKKMMSLAQYSFSETEFAWLSALPENEQESAFWQLWTIRESILKLAGKGVWQMKEMAVEPFSRRVSAEFSQRLNCWSCRQDDVFWAVATNIDIAVNNIRLWRASEDLASLIPEQTPNLTRFHSDPI